MARKVHWPALFAAVIGGVLIGLSVPMIGLTLGMSPKLVGPITGGLAGGLIPLIYKAQVRRNAGGKAP